MQIKKAVYITQADHIRPLLHAGATQFIIETAQYSPRNFIHNKNEHDSLETLTKALHTEQITAWLNIEKICHPSDITQLRNTDIPYFKTLKITHFRVHDLGLIQLFNEYYPEATLCYAAEFGNSNSQSVKTLSQHVSAQQLSNDCPLDSLINIRKHCPQNQLWLQVHGPILIQYSKRRYLNYLEKNETSPYGFTRYIEDEEHPKRPFKVFDSPLGHCMFANFDRCLLKVLPELLTCNLDTWLIDGRGESLSYTLAALKAFQEAQKDLNTHNNSAKNTKAWSCPKTIWDPLQKQSPKALTAVYFKANESDRERPNPRPIPENASKIGSIIDVIKGQQCSILLSNTLSSPILKQGDTLLISTPSGRLITLKITTLTDAFQTPITNSQNQDMISINWQKGLEVKSWVFIDQEKS